MEPNRISVNEVKQRMDQGESFALVDARNPKAWGESSEKLPGAIRLPADQVDQQLPAIPKDRAVVSYCT